LEEASNALWAAIFWEELEKSTPPDHLTDSRNDTQAEDEAIMKQMREALKKII
jgi:hypothetical protein